MFFLALLSQNLGAHKSGALIIYIYLVEWIKTEWIEYWIQLPSLYFSIYTQSAALSAIITPIEVLRAWFYQVQFSVVGAVQRSKNLNSANFWTAPYIDVENELISFLQMSQWLSKGKKLSLLLRHNVSSDKEIIQQKKFFFCLINQMRIWPWLISCLSALRV